MIHDNPAWLSAAHPLLPPVRWSAAPAARRYVSGWPMEGEIHVLADEWMERRAGGEDSLNALLGTAERMYCQLTLAANNDALPPMWTPRRALTYFRWAWLVEGASQYFSGQVSLFRPAVITRLREGEKPRFPPTRRDAILLGGTVFDLLDRHAGPEACALLASRLRKEGPAANLEFAFEAHTREIEKAWRHHLDDILYPAAATPGADPLQDTGERPSPLDPKPAPALRKRVSPEPEVDLHDLALNASAPKPPPTSTPSSRTRSPASPGSGAAPACAPRPARTCPPPPTSTSAPRRSSASRAQRAATAMARSTKPIAADEPDPQGEAKRRGDPGD